MYNHFTTFANIELKKLSTWLELSKQPPLILLTASASAKSKMIAF